MKQYYADAGIISPRKFERSYMVETVNVEWLE